MITDDLFEYYKRMSEGDDAVLPHRYWSIEKAVWEFVLDEDGTLVNVIPLADETVGKKFRLMNVPEHETRASGVKAFFLCDKSSYINGYLATLGEDEKLSNQLSIQAGARYGEACQQYHGEILDGVDDPGARAVLGYLANPKRCSGFAEDMLMELDKGGFIVFRLFGDGYIHERPLIRQAWLKYKAKMSGADAPQGQCAVTGEVSPIARLHPLIKGIPGAQSSGASFIGFNQESFCSYGKSKNDQGRNASISEEAAFGMGAALSYLVNDPKHRMRLGADTVVFWTDGVTTEIDDAFFGVCIDPDARRREYKEDAPELDRIEATLKNVREGKPIAGLDADTRFFILGLSPNAARLSIRFYEVWSLGDLEKSLGQYLRDTEMIGQRGRSIWVYLAQTAPLGKISEVPSTLICSSVDAMMTGAPFPRALFNQLVSRTRIDHASRNSWDLGQRASMMRACLVRDARRRGNQQLERSITVALNEENQNMGYLLGRLFAVLEKAQKEAIPGANATIRNRYIGSASATPARVFPQLIRMSQYHISKADYGYVEDRRMQDILSRIDSLSGFPKTLSYDDQGQFFIGYYQQKESFYQKTDGAEGQFASDVDIR